MEIGTIQPVQPLEIGALAGQGVRSGGSDFGSLLQAAYHKVEQSGTEATRMVDQYLSGETQDLHSVALAGQRASLQFEMMLQVRNKLVQAYQEVMRMQL